MSAMLDCTKMRWPPGRTRRCPSRMNDSGSSSRFVHLREPDCHPLPWNTLRLLDHITTLVLRPLLVVSRDAVRILANELATDPLDLKDGANLKVGKARFQPLRVGGRVDDLHREGSLLREAGSEDQ